MNRCKSCRREIKKSINYGPKCAKKLGLAYEGIGVDKSYNKENNNIKTASMLDAFSKDPDVRLFGSNSLGLACIRELQKTWQNIYDLQKTTGLNLQVYLDAVHELAEYIRKNASKAKSPIPTEFVKGLNIVETVLAKIHPVFALKWNEYRYIATSSTENIFGEDEDNTVGNAYKHAYWNALASRDGNSALARIFGIAHEFGAVGLWSSDSPPASATFPYLSSLMDLTNNQSGRWVGEANQGKSDAEISKLVLAAVNNGEMVYQDGNKTKRTNQ